MSAINEPAGYKPTLAERLLVPRNRWGRSSMRGPVFPWGGKRMAGPVAPGAPASQSWGIYKPRALGSLGQWYNPFSWAQIVYSGASDVGALKTDFDSYVTQFGSYVNWLTSWISNFTQPSNIDNWLMGSKQIGGFLNNITGMSSTLNKITFVLIQQLSILNNAAKDISSYVSSSGQDIAVINSQISAAYNAAYQILSELSSGLASLPNQGLSGLRQARAMGALGSVPNWSSLDMGPLIQALRLMAQAGVVLSRSESAMVSAANTISSNLPQMENDLHAATSTLDAINTQMTTIATALGPIAAAVTGARAVGYDISHVTGGSFPPPIVHPPIVHPPNIHPRVSTSAGGGGVGSPESSGLPAGVVAGSGTTPVATSTGIQLHGLRGKSLGESVYLVRNRQR